MTAARASAAPGKPGWLRRTFRHGISGWMTQAVYLFMFLPIVVLIVLSFNDAKSTVVWKGFLPRWHGAVFDNRNIGQALHVSLILTVASAAISTAIGTLATGLAPPLVRRQNMCQGAEVRDHCDPADVGYRLQPRHHPAYRRCRPCRPGRRGVEIWRPQLLRLPAHAP